MRVPHRILVPTDLSPFSLEALQYAEEVGKLFNGEIIVLHALDPKEPGGSRLHIRPEEAEFEARKSIVHLLMEHAIVPLNFRLEIRHGSPVEEILKAVKQLNIDLIVMSTHGRTGLSHVLIGSIAEHVVRLAPVPVLTIMAEGPDEIVDLREEDIKTNLHLN